MKLRSVPLLVGLLLAVACTNLGDEFPWLDTLELGDQVRASGSRLAALDFGLHALEPSDANDSRVVIGVHGWRTQGYEWVYPLKTLNEDGVSVYFFRWDYDQCPIEGSRMLQSAVQDLLTAVPSLEQITLVGHSMGGMLLAAIAQDWDMEISTDIHVVASPLTMVENDNCPTQNLPSSLPTNVSLWEWRTLHHLDGAFQHMPEDPQNVDLGVSVVTRLGEDYNGHRLGHNWSISQVADLLVAKTPQ